MSQPWFGMRLGKGSMCENIGGGEGGIEVRGAWRGRGGMMNFLMSGFKGDERLIQEKKRVRHDRGRRSKSYSYFRWIAGVILGDFFIISSGF